MKYPFLQAAARLPHTASCLDRYRIAALSFPAILVAIAIYCSALQASREAVIPLKALQAGSTKRESAATLHMEHLSSLCYRDKGVFPRVAGAFSSASVATPTLAGILSKLVQRNQRSQEAALDVGIVDSAIRHLQASSVQVRLALCLHAAQLQSMLSVRCVSISTTSVQILCRGQSAHRAL